MLTASHVAFVLTLFAATRDVLGWTFHLPKFGGCPDLESQPKFLSNIESFLKTWYVQSSFDTEILQGKGRCMTATYKYNPLNSVIYVATQQFNEDNNMWEKLEASASPANVSKDNGKFEVKFTIPIWGEVSGTYTVLGTNLDTYAVIHGCGSFLGILHYDVCWLFSNKQKLSAEEEEEFNKNTLKVLDKYDFLEPKEFKKVDQVNCDK